MPMQSGTGWDYLTTTEVADYLRLKERKIYDLVARSAIPHVRITGKLLFPRRLIDLWVTEHVVFEGPTLQPPPPIAAGSSDPLLDWALRESGSGLAVLATGSEAGLAALAEGDATLAGLHLLDPDTGTYNVSAVAALKGFSDLVLIRWAHRRQGLVTARDNPLGLLEVVDLARKHPRLATRQSGAGSQVLLKALIAEAGLDERALNLLPTPALTEADLAHLVLEGEADCGLAIEAAARRFSLGFVFLREEAFDLALSRRTFFEPAFQKLLAFARSTAFRERAGRLGGYDLSPLGTVIYNA